MLSGAYLSLGVHSDQELKKIIRQFAKKYNNAFADEDLEEAKSYRPMSIEVTIHRLNEDT